MVGGSEKNTDEQASSYHHHLRPTTRYAWPDAFGDVSDDERRTYGRVLDDYYSYADSLVGDARFSGTHERAPGGFMMVFGAPIAAGRLNRGGVVDGVQTLLYLFGLPVARDMDGVARTDVFTAGFNSERTITSIPTYERR